MRFVLIGLTLLGTTVIASADPGDAAGAPARHQAIHPAERYFTPDMLQQALRQSGGAPSSPSSLSGLLDSLPQDPEQLKALAKMAQAASGLTQSGDDPTKTHPGLRNLADRMAKDPGFRSLVERLANDSNLRERLQNDPKLREMMEQMSRQFRSDGRSDSALRQLEDWAAREGASNRRNSGGERPAPRPLPPFPFNEAGRRTGPPGSGRDGIMPPAPANNWDSIDSRGPSDRSPTDGELPSIGNAAGALERFTGDSGDASYETVLKMAKALERHGGALAQSPTVQRMVAQLQSSPSIGRGSSLPMWKPPELDPILNSVRGINERTSSIRRWGSSVGNQIRGRMPNMPPLPKLPKLPSISVPSIRLPIPRLPSVALPSLSLPSMGTLPDLPTLGTGVVTVVGAIALVFLVIAFLGKNWQQHQVERLCRRQLTDDRLSPRERIRKVFEYLALTSLGESVRSNHHRHIAGKLGSSSPARQSAADGLANLYELARYTPANEPLTADDAKEAQEHYEALAKSRLFG